MKSALLAVGCLLAGALIAFGYSHYLGEGKQLADLQVEVRDQAMALSAAQKEGEKAKSETEAMSAQIQQLTATKADLQKQVEDLKSAAAPSQAVPMPPGFSSSSMAAIVKAQMASRKEEKFQRLVKRLNLTDDQQVTLRAAMDAEDNRIEEMTTKMLAGGNVYAVNQAEEIKQTKSVDQTLNDMLTETQKTIYQEMKTDEKTNSAEAMASVEMNQMATSLNLSETQKDQVGSALYQNQLNLQDPAWLKANMGSIGTDSLAIIDAQARAKEDALAKVLTPDQLALYHQQAQAQLAMQKSIMQKFMPATGTAPAPAKP